MGRRVFACVAVGMVAMATCVALAACGLATSGLEEAARDDASSGARPDAERGKDGRSGSGSGSGGGDDGAGDGMTSEPPHDSGTSDVFATDAVSSDGEGQADAPFPDDVAAEAPPPPPTCTGCAANQCCSNGACVKVSNAACGNGDQACVDCTTPPGSLAGNQCIVPQGQALNVCGCAGPGNENQCPTGNACHNQQCGTSCDGQHPCNGGCCSGNDLASSTCLAVCANGMSCQGNYCQ